MIGPRQRAESGLLQLPLERIAQRLLALRVAAAPPVPGLADIPADEDMMGERRHFRSIGPGDCGVLDDETPGSTSGVPITLKKMAPRGKPRVRSAFPTTERSNRRS